MQRNFAAFLRLRRRTSIFIKNDRQRRRAEPGVPRAPTPHRRLGHSRPAHSRQRAPTSHASESVGFEQSHFKETDFLQPEQIIQLGRAPNRISTYELAPGQATSVISEGDKLFVERMGKKEQLLPETSELFFRKGVEGRSLFHYATNGKVDTLIDRRNNEDVIWRKTK